LADWQSRLEDKIERLSWCLNLHLLDGFDREELDRLTEEVGRFGEAVRASNRKVAA
jgi:hypothetical protein